MNQVVKRLLGELQGSLPALDGLRGLAVLLVLMIHSSVESADNTGNETLLALQKVANPVLGLGGTGVHLFFVLSGFLLFRPYLQAALLGASWPSASNFYYRRFVRIVPAYWAAIVLLVIFIPEYHTLSKVPDVVLHILLLHNVLTATNRTLNVVFWTMAIEWQFYLILPFLAARLGAWYRTQQWRKLYAAVALLLMCSPLTSVLSVGIQHVLPSLSPYLSILGVASFGSTFFLGMVAAWCYTRYTHATDSQRQAWQPRLKTAATVSGILLLVRVVLNRFPNERFDYLFFALYMGVLYATLLIGTLLARPAWNRLFSSPWLRYIGLISYSVYIWHYPLYRLLMPWLRGMGALEILVGVVAVNLVVLGVSVVSFVCFEKPFFPVRDHLREQKSVPPVPDLIATADPVV